MANSFGKRLTHAWNAFQGKDQVVAPGPTVYSPQFSRPTRLIHNDKSIVNTIFNLIAVDVSSVNIRHAVIGQNGRYEGDYASDLNECLSVAANIDQTARAFIQDLVLSILDWGYAAVVPVDTTFDIRTSTAFDIKSMRVGKIVEWYPRHVRVEVYNDNAGLRQEVTLPKSSVAIVVNPLYEIINQSNSTLQRLLRKLSILDSIDEASSASKLNMIIQLPYTVRSSAQKQYAEERVKTIEDQLRNAEYGIAYTDGTENIVQLNRPLENNLLEQIKYLTGQLYSRLGITEAVFNGTASDSEMNNYQNRTVIPILNAIVDSMNRTFLTKTARTRGQGIVYIKDPFKFVPPGSIPQMADIFVRNEILTANEIRAILGYLPASDETADQLRNSNINPLDVTPALEPVIPGANETSLEEQTIGG